MDSHGFIPSTAFGQLPNAICPQVKWSARPALHRLGRTYIAGLTGAATDGSGNANELNALYRLSIESGYAQLNNDLFFNYGLDMVLLVTQRDGVKLPLAESYPITQVRATPATMGTRITRIHRRRRRA